MRCINNSRCIESSDEGDDVGNLVPGVIIFYMTKSFIKIFFQPVQVGIFFLQGIVHRFVAVDDELQYLLNCIAATLRGYPENLLNKKRSKVGITVINML